MNFLKYEKYKNLNLKISQNLIIFSSINWINYNSESYNFIAYRIIEIIHLPI